MLSDRTDRAMAMQRAPVRGGRREKRVRYPQGPAQAALKRDRREQGSKVTTFGPRTGALEDEALRQASAEP